MIESNQGHNISGSLSSLVEFFTKLGENHQLVMSVMIKYLCARHFYYGLDRTEVKEHLLQCLKEGYEINLIWREKEKEHG